MATTNHSEIAVGKQRKHKHAHDKPAQVNPRALTAKLRTTAGNCLHKASVRSSSGSSTSSSSSDSSVSSLSSYSANSSSYLSSANSSRSNSSRAAGYRPSTGIHYLSWFIPRYLVSPAAQEGCKPLIPAEEKEEDEANSKEEEVPDPLHSKKKITWLATHTNDQLSSLPIPPPYHPPILNYPAPHAENIGSAFRKQHPPISYYCRHACPSWPHHWMVPHTLLPAIPIISSAEAGQSLPPPPLPQPPPLSPPPPLPRFQPDPPPQSMFANVGAAPRRNFTVHPDWRRVQRP